LRETAEVFPAISLIHRTLDKKQQLLENQELSDRLTGLSNRRQFNIEFARAYDFARRGTPVCVVLLRLQCLEKLSKNQVNQVVSILACTLNEHARRVDHAARLDTDHFALLMFGASPEGTTPCLERISRSFRKHQEDHPAIPNDSICTLSIGYTRIHAHRDGNAAQVLKRAEAALAEAENSNDRHIINA
jgi:diguanylate cyclase (GGDEF)-like protein